jgi:flagellar hook-associated protein 2
MTVSSSTSNSATGTITSTGIGSGLDVNSIITQLMAAESQPLKLLQNQATSINTQISAIGQMTSLASALSTKSQALESPSLWSGVSDSSSDASAVTADTSAGGASPGNYAVSVQALAQSQTVTSNALASSSSTLNAGTLTIELGSWTGTPASGFSPKSGASAVTINIGDGDTSLASIRDKINAAGAGVQASIITDANGARLSLRSNDTGAENGFRVTAAETVDDGNAATGLSALSYDMLGASSMGLNQSAQNAKVTVNGIGIESASNTLTSVSDGMDLTVSKVTTSPVNIAVTQNIAGMTQAINDFVSAFNSLNANIVNQTKYDATAKTGGPLQGDPSVIGFQGQMRGIVTQAGTGSSMYSTLSQIGITLQKDGSLGVDSTKLAAAMKNVGEVRKLFAATGTGAGQGVAVGIQKAADAATTLGGRLYSENIGLQAQLRANSDSQANMQTHLDQDEKRYQTQFQALDTTMAKMNALSSYMTQQLASLTTTTK